MTLDEYWNGSSVLCKYYREANKIQIERKNQELWLQGLYVCDAFAVVLSNAFAKKGSKKSKYLEEPIQLFPLTEEEKKEKEIQEYEKINQQLHRLKQTQKNKKIGNKK